ncbi:CRISPR-associated endoribonuclease Cas2 [Dellaglioa algida]|uniref:CRISPR-associated endoribonuclease Cas2 n=2 Tax=Dellaglioa algida TaxID=105612 RepID=A0A5C6M9X4_9LACO|nr:CRISPR-associated endoribonuclease Cas2 [Dellaglioa algida]
MRYRIMRLLVMFDLPTKTSSERRAYRHFRKSLLNEGFLMIQYSVYVRVCVSKQSAQFIENRIASYVPDEGLIQTLMVTEQQYNKMHFLAGELKKDVRNSSERTLIL